MLGLDRTRVTLSIAIGRLFADAVHKKYFLANKLVGKPGRDIQAKALEDSSFGLK